MKSTTSFDLENNIIIACLLWFFLWFIAGHRLYAKKYSSAILFMGLEVLVLFLFFTVIGAFLAIPLMGLLFMWWLVDLALIFSWGFTIKKITVTTEN